MKQIGVYLIRNVTTKQVYVGSSCDIKHRWAVHKSALRGGYHDNKYLQNSWNKYGENTFVFEVHALCELTDLLEQEQLLANDLKSANRKHGFNIGEFVASSMRGRKHSEETKTKISQRFSNEGNPNYGNHWSDEVKDRIRVGLQEYYKTHEKVVSDDTRSKISEAQKGQKGNAFGKCGKLHARSRAVEKLHPETFSVIETYDSANIAAKANSFARGNLCKLLQGVGKTLGGFAWRWKQTD